MSCFLPSSVMLKSAGFRPLIGFPLLSFTETSTTTNWVVVPNLTTGLVAGGVCAVCCVCGGCAETTSSPLKSVAMIARIGILNLESETQRGCQAAHVTGIGKLPQRVASNGGVESGEGHMIQRVGRVEAQIDALALRHPEGAAERPVQAELGGPDDGVSSRVAPLSGCRNREGEVVERLSRRRTIDRQPGGVGAQAAGDAGARGGGAHAAHGGRQRHSAA